MEADLAYPVGRFRRKEEATQQDRSEWIRIIRELPQKTRAAVGRLDDVRLDTQYRDGGWTVRQVVHHVADSHMNAYIRCKLALTETLPRIKPYDQDAWAALPDTRTLPVEPSLAILDGLHLRWAALLESLSGGDWAKTFDHPVNGPMTLDHTLQLYAWHSRHHLAHITGLLDRRGWV